MSKLEKSPCAGCHKLIADGFSRSMFSPLYCKKCVSSEAFQAALSPELRRALRKTLGQTKDAWVTSTLNCVRCATPVPERYLEFWKDIGPSSSIKTGPALYCECGVKIKTIKRDRKVIVVESN